MTTVDEIVSAAARLEPEQFLLLRAELDRLEERLWEAELAQTAVELNEANLTDEEVDRLVLRRRREGRS